MELTQLQKLGVSFILRDLMNHSGYMGLKHGGEIHFVNKPERHTAEMWVYPYADECQRIHYTLNVNERIDDLVKYRFSYDAHDKLFIIYTIKGGSNHDLC